MQLQTRTLQKLLDDSLKEDYGIKGDITSDAVINSETQVKFAINARQNLVLCGIQIAQYYFNEYSSIKYQIHHTDSEIVQKNTAIISGQLQVSGVGSSASIQNALSVGGNLQGTTATFINTLTASNNAIVGGTLSSTNATINNLLTVNSQLTIGMHLRPRGGHIVNRHRIFVELHRQRKPYKHADDCASGRLPGPQSLLFIHQTGPAPVGCALPVHGRSWRDRRAL
jgi:hypothetical protein